jgi:hypothetical protein
MAMEDARLGADLGSDLHMLTHEQTLVAAQIAYDLMLGCQIGIALDQASDGR